MLLSLDVVDKYACVCLGDGGELVGWWLADIVVKDMFVLGGEVRVIISLIDKFAGLGESMKPLSLLMWPGPLLIVLFAVLVWLIKCCASTSSFVDVLMGERGSCFCSTTELKGRDTFSG